MNWTIAVPEIVLSCIGMAILVFGVLRKQDSTMFCTMFTLGGFLVTALLVLTRVPGLGYHGQFVSDAFSAFDKVLILAGAALTAILALDYNRKQGIARFEFPVLLLFSVVGMMVMASASNLMTLYLGLELMSLALYVLAAFRATTCVPRRPGSSISCCPALPPGCCFTVSRWCMASPARWISASCARFWCSRRMPRSG